MKRSNLMLLLVYMQMRKLSKWLPLFNGRCVSLDSSCREHDFTSGE